MVQIQLKNLESLLDGEVSHSTMLDSRGNISYKYTITYKDNANDDSTGDVPRDTGGE